MVSAYRCAVAGLRVMVSSLDRQEVAKEAEGKAAPGAFQ